MKHVFLRYRRRNKELVCLRRWTLSYPPSRVKCLLFSWLSFNRFFTKILNALPDVAGFHRYSLHPIELIDDNWPVSLKSIFLAICRVE